MSQTGFLNKQALIISLVAVTVIASGCLDSEEAEVELPEGDVEVAVGEMYFEQQEAGLETDVLRAEIGDEIVFYNEGDIPHTVTVPEFELDRHLEPGEHIVLEVDKSVENGLVDCRLHGNHDATLTVE